MLDTTRFKFRAFLSYSHRDKKWGRWLHKALEGYRIDKDLVGRETATGAIPKTLRPIFRARDDFAAGHSLTKQTRAALETSAFLIVLCSPNSARSDYVNEEVQFFKAMGRADHVIPVTAEPSSFEFDADGQVTSTPAEPIAADARDVGDGKALVLAKVVAGLLGLDLDEIVRRAKRAERRRRVRNGIIGALLFLTSAAIGAAVFAYQKLIESERRLDQAVELATNFVNRAVALTDEMGVRQRVILGFLQEADRALTAFLDDGADTPKLRYRRATMLIEFARSYKRLGQSNEQLRRATEARRLLAELVESKPNKESWLHGLAAAHSDIGDVLTAQGDLTGTLASYRASLAIAERLVQADPENAGWQHDLSVSHIKIGDVLTAQGDLTSALASYQASLAIAERLTQADPQNAGWQRDLAWSHWRLAANGDQPRLHWQRVVDILRGLDADGRLSPVDRKWLPIAERNLAAAE